MHAWGIVEGEWVPSNTVAYAMAPFRACKYCGFAERGWGCGYHILKGDAEEISRDDAFRFVVGKIHPNGNFVRVGDILDKDILYKSAVEKDDINLFRLSPICHLTKE